MTEQKNFECQCCKSERIVLIDAKCSDCCFASSGKYTHDGYVPSDMGIGSDDYVEFQYCLECGQIQGKFPLPEIKLEQEGDEEE
jgi:hypothetical protein